ncbi:hypothetical protein GCM10009530_52280 [Microbispora corallina]|uniref:HTH tetR-type domain-containing protein n=1 Tax=Microbispora corallina TaxID=83302 RepID=A0ABQ4G346_9ACTN|nr:TetR/AcrR family transcriptional regulator [Microbispora corallina]GIH41403.1 hypothetical protein Mco01_44030 [Microbispora corallina]
MPAGERDGEGEEREAPVRRLRRADRREQILDAATRAFARAGFTATGLDDVASEAGVTRVILYRHFDSKADLYRAVLDRGFARLEESVGAGGFGGETIPALVRAAAADPDAFRLLFRHAAGEPEFRGVIDALTEESREVSRSHLVSRIPDPAWLEWASRLLPVVTVEAVIAWLDAGSPDPETAAARIRQVVNHVIETAVGGRR